MLVALFLCIRPAYTHAAPVFEDHFESLANWEVLDFTGDATVQLGTDDTTPPGYGPEVLILKGDHVMGLARELIVGDGTFVVLYRELDPVDHDADGILLFNAQYGDDIRVEHNTKLIRPMMWLEQDNDTGLHIRAKINETTEAAFAEQSGIGLVTDDWNETNWIWQKVRVDNGEISAKYWPAQLPESEAWVLREHLEKQPAARAGFRTGSGSVAIAYFAYAQDDIRPVAPDYYLLPSQSETICGNPVFLSLYSNAQSPARGYSLSLLENDVEIASIENGVLLRPYLGEYRVDSDSTEFSTRNALPDRLLATVVETYDAQIFVNGEPFIVKGVNVHSLDSGSPERSRNMVRVLKRLGFNMLRGDYPPLWQIEMAHEENMTWSVLAPFSCVSTDQIFARYEGAPMVSARAKARDFIFDYKEFPGVLLWNSSNEIGNETTDFLVSMYPVYKHYDPYGRPSHYANLYGQDRWQGQDIMAVNYYFAPGQSPEDRHPLIQRSIDIAKEHGLPIIYTEYNSYHGPVPEKGVEAIYGLFGWGIENGMSGGFMYDKWMGEDHPGVFNEDLEVDPAMEAAFIDVFADAEISLIEQRGEDVVLEIRNKRPFTLRSFVLRLNKGLLSLGDIEPFSTITVRQSSILKSKILSGELPFETHYGLRCRIPFNIEPN